MQIKTTANDGIIVMHHCYQFPGQCRISLPTHCIQCTVQGTPSTSQVLHCSKNTSSLSRLVIVIKMIHNNGHGHFTSINMLQVNSVTLQYTKAATRSRLCSVRDINVNSVRKCPLEALSKEANLELLTDVLVVHLGVSWEVHDLDFVSRSHTTHDPSWAAFAAPTTTAPMATTTGTTAATATAPTFALAQGWRKGTPLALADIANAFERRPCPALQCHGGGSLVNVVKGPRCWCWQWH